MSVTTRQSIEKELNELWKPERQQRETATTWFQRNYTVNLVVYASTMEYCREGEAVLRELTPIHPGRYIMLCPAPELQTVPLNHHVSGHCVYNPERKKQICCDIISLEAKAGILEQLYGLTLSLLISDLPVEFWWLGEVPMPGAIFHKIADDSDRVWVDSSKFAQPQISLAHLAFAWNKSFPKTVLADLNWIRFKRWRNLIAELFDGEWTQYLARISEVTIEYGEGRQPTRSFLLACWMASRLGWKYRGEPLTEFPDRIEFDSAAGPVTVAITLVPVADKRRDRLYAIRIRTGDQHEGLFTVERDKDPQCVSACSVLNGQVSFSRILYFEHQEPLHLLGEGLRHWGKDSSWEGTLAVFRTIIREPESIPGLWP